MCEVERQGTGVVRLDKGQPVEHVLVLGKLIFSFERVTDTLVGTHAEVSSSTAQRVVGKLDALADDWQQAVIAS